MNAPKTLGESSDWGEYDSDDGIDPSDLSGLIVNPLEEDPGKGIESDYKWSAKDKHNECMDYYVSIHKTINKRLQTLPSKSSGRNVPPKEIIVTGLSLLLCFGYEFINYLKECWEKFASDQFASDQFGSDKKRSRDGEEDLSGRKKPRLDPAFIPGETAEDEMITDEKEREKTTESTGLEWN